MQRIWLWPWWLIEVFSAAKSFRDNPILGNRFLNRCGLHVVRLVLAHGISHLRWGLLAHLTGRETRRRFLTDGYLKIENVVPRDQFEQICAEAAACEGEVRECIQGDTLTQRILLDEETLGRLPATRALLSARNFLGMLKFAAAKNARPLFYFQKIKNGYVEGPDDPQKSLHSDTFHPSLKAWLFLEDVPREHGPFTFVAGSHRLSRRRLAWEYHRSIQGAEMADDYGRRGSMRAEADDLAQMGLPSAQAFAVEANTLVVANTFGFHCRGQASGRCSRLEIWAYSRGNPFNPWPGLGLALADRLHLKLVKAYLRHQDRRATRRGGRASWHIVPGGEFHA